MDHSLKKGVLKMKLTHFVAMVGFTISASVFAANGVNTDQAAINTLQQQIQSTTATIHQEMAAQQAATQKAIADLQSQVQAQIAHLQTEMQQMQAQLTNEIKQVQSEMIKGAPVVTATPTTAPAAASTTEAAPAK
jgi:TolA-binding protein